MNDYSQHGEGKIIHEFFKNKKGVLLSLGENDGKTLSNVLGLIEVGWIAHLVEPSEHCFNELKNRHSENKNVNCYKLAIGNSNSLVDFYESGTHLGTGDTSLLSSIDKNEIKRWGKTAKFESKKTQCLTFESFIKEAEILNFDLISIDCEGLDFDILKQIDFIKYTPSMVVVETNSVDNQKYIDLMASFGYSIHYKNYCNIIFTK